MTKDNTPSGETVDEALAYAFRQGFKLALGNFYNVVVANTDDDDKDIADLGKQLRDIRNEVLDEESRSLRQAIEGMVERIIGEEADKHKPPFSQHDYGFMSANAVNDRVSKQRQRAKEEISKLFGKE